MKKFLIVLLSLVSVSVFAEQLDFERFSMKVLKEFPQIDYVSYNVWENWNGDAEAFIKYYKENGTDVPFDNGKELMKIFKEANYED